MSVKKREKIACFGAPGSYSHEALYCHFGKSADIVFYDHFEDLVNRVEAGECRYGVLPVENSSTGGIAEVYDLILRHNCHIVGEEYVHVQHLLLGVPGARMEDIRHVYSHPQGL
ncbi:prephenate dehydratase domain-containing protein, partial [Anaeroglobus sp. AF13-6AC]|uniref:prephenate dehydratase domain-containing protein n=1 Tax=Anaeroglobus sp. AF13-6AC TaxID=2997918 RepID=UPI002FD90971